MDWFLNAFLKHVRNQPQALALKTPYDEFSYEELNNLVASVMPLLAQEKGKAIGIYADDSFSPYVSILATWFTHNFYVPIHPKFPVSRNLNVIQQAEVQKLFVSEEKVPELPKEFGHLEIAAIGKTNKNNPKTIPNPTQSPLDNPVYLLFTSGSTGTPKGVPISVKNLTSFMQEILRIYDFKSEDRFLQMFDLTFDLSVFSYAVPWFIGASVHIVPSDGITFLNVFDVLEENEITVALMVPSVLSYLEKYFDEINLPKLRYSLFCGEALKHSLVKKWKSCIPNAEVHNLYGPTEGTIFCSKHIWEEEAEYPRNIVSIGKPFSTTKFLISEDGELLLGGSQITQGYWKNPRKNEESFVFIEGERFYKTGDLVTRDKEGAYHYLGRKDYQVKIDGYRVELLEVEAKLQKVLGKETVCIVREKQGKNQIIAFVRSTGKELSASEKRAIKRELVSYMYPSDFVFLKEFPLNSNGKIDRNKLSASFLEQ